MTSFFLYITGVKEPISFRWPEIPRINEKIILDDQELMVTGVTWVVDKPTGLPFVRVQSIVTWPLQPGM